MLLIKKTYKFVYQTINIFSFEFLNLLLILKLNVMSKEKSPAKETKKVSEKSLKEKRAEKKAKRESKRD